MASGKGVKRHIHMYHYLNIGYGFAWVCALADCSHFMPVIFEGSRIDQRVLGKKSICWNCRSEFILDEDAMLIDEPNCINCREPELAEITKPRTLEEILAEKRKIGENKTQ